jgi:hypothetical protein
MDAAMAAVLSPTLVASTLAILTITAAAQDRDQIGVPVGADLDLTRPVTASPARRPGRAGRWPVAGGDAVITAGLDAAGTTLTRTQS